MKSKSYLLKAEMKNEEELKINEVKGYYDILKHN
jgi:hypothetical protein